MRPESVKRNYFRRNAYFYERSFPGRKLQSTPNLQDNGTNLIGVDFKDKGILWMVTKACQFEGSLIFYYINKANNDVKYSSVKEVRTWCHQTTLKQTINTIKPTREAYINTLVEESFKAITTYNRKLPPNSTKPTSFKKAGNQPLTQWSRTKEKKRGGFSEFDTWERLAQNEITPEIRKRVLRCHHLYEIKRDQTAKNRVVVNGSCQHSDTYTDTTSPISSQLQLRLFLAVSAFRKYDIVQLDLTNAYMHASILDVVYIYVPEGFPGQGEIERLRKATYDTKEGAQFYDYIATVLRHIKLCLFRHLHNVEECFFIQYVDDSLIAGHPHAIT
jgi:hypothetical protein